MVRNPKTDNPLKREGQRKATTRRLADQTLEPTPERTPAPETETGQGGSAKGGGKPTGRHSSQHGGVKDELDERRPR